MQKDDKSLVMVDVENVCLNYLFRQLCFLRLIGLLFVTVVSHLSQSCFSRIMCNLHHLALWCVFIVLSHWRYPSQHRCDFRSQIEMCVVHSYLEVIAQFVTVPCDCSCDVTTFAIPLTWVYIKY